MKRIIKCKNVIFFLCSVFCVFNINYASNIIGADKINTEKKGPGFEIAKEKKIISSNHNLENPFLILVNSSNPIDVNFVPPLKEVRGGLMMHESVARIVNKMIKDAKKEDINLVVLSAYRSAERQAQLFEGKVKANVEKGMDLLTATVEAAKINPLPGTSEHQTGLCMDIVDKSNLKLDYENENTLGYKWLLEHCAEYGFILRYPKDKTEITGIIYEPWHFRYVGVDIAKTIMENKLTLEEYIDIVSKAKK